MRVFSSSLMFKQNNIGSQSRGERASGTETNSNSILPQLTPPPPAHTPHNRCARFSALHGVCILLLITKASEEFKFKFEFQFQFEFHFVSRLSLCFFSTRFVSLGRQHRKRTIKPNAEGEMKRKRKVAKNVCGHFTSREK